jgi:gamma-glutamyltranspeptidase/glutathione hydrolase
MTQKVVEHGHDELVPKVFDGESSVPETGQVVRRARLAKTLEAWVNSDGRALHEGPLAEDLVAAVQAAGGILTLEDLANYRPVEKEPIRVPWGERTVLTMNAPGGGAVVAQVISVLDDDLREGCTRPCDFDVARAHRFLEAQKHAYADRGRYMADPDFEEVALDVMLGGERIAAIQDAFNADQVLDRSAYAVPLHPPQDAGTHHISVIDNDGYAVALTTTINTGFGSMVVAEKSGVVLNNEMDDFAPFPSSPISEGVQGSALNHIEPGKRPVSSMSPTVVLNENDEPILAAGASGGPLIISSTLQVVLSVLELGQSPEDAVSARRFHHRWAGEGEGLFLDTRGAPSAETPDTLATGLADLGHDVIPFDFFSSVQIVTRTGDQFDGASDPRKGGVPARPGDVN